MTETAKLFLPYIAPSQAQKHVTHNESLRILDSLVQMRVLSDSISTPPPTPQNGDSYILPNTPAGVWASHDAELAVYEENIWAFYAPKPGWRAWVESLNEMLVFDGSAWTSLFAEPDFQNLDQVGINTTADLTNRLSVSSPATLLNHEGAGHQLKLNKASSTDTASLLFQTNWSGRAEMGINGSDDFSIKVSNDGATFHQGILISQSSGEVSFPSGIAGVIEQINLGNSVFIGEGAGANDDLSDNRNVFIGTNTGQSNVTGSNNVAVGGQALQNNTTGWGNSSSGIASLFSNTTGAGNTAVGYTALYANTTGASNVAVGNGSLRFATGSNNTALGKDSLRFTTTGANHGSYSGCTGVGRDARVSGSDQVQLGNSSTTTYAFGAVQDRSDRRDKADVRDSKLGLGFINQLRPVDYRLDMRDDYFDYIETTDEETGEVLDVKMERREKDGSRKRKRYHHGFIAQEVKEVMDKLKLDFGGYQDHSLSGGDDVLSLGYQEMIAPMVRAIQELSEKVDNLHSGQEQ